jgi:UDP:flavonoid glycosyltransferase YjiC (YdhE family)
VAEAVTLAHVARPLAALRNVDSARWQSIVASDPRVRHHFDGSNAEFRPLPSIDSGDFLRALQRGAPVYDTATLRRYVDADLALLRDTQPDLVIGDFRLSLSVSARVAGIPYATIASACLSPQYHPPAGPVPALTLPRSLPLPMAAALVRVARPIAFRRHAAPINRLRRAFGLPAIDGDVRHVYTDADYVLYTDVPELFPAAALPANQRFVGPALWEPATSAPWSWPGTADRRARVYITLGSSGAAELLPKII